MGTIYYETAPMPQTDGTNIVVNGDGKLDLGTDITTKLSKVGEQILGAISGDTITFTDSTNTYIGGSGSDTYLLDAYVSDTDRYIKSQSISGNTFTVVCDDVIASGSIAVCTAIKKGV